jgi:hypothetical protein
MGGDTLGSRGLTATGSFDWVRFAFAVLAAVTGLAEGGDVIDVNA